MNSDSRFICAVQVFWKLFSTIQVGGAKFSCPPLDLSALSRWLADAVLCPTALLPSQHLRWEACETGADSARAVLTHGELTPKTRPQNFYIPLVEGCFEVSSRIRVGCNFANSLVGPCMHKLLRKVIDMETLWENMENLWKIYAID